MLMKSEEPSLLPALRSSKVPSGGELNPAETGAFWAMGNWDTRERAEFASPVPLLLLHPLSYFPFTIGTFICFHFRIRTTTNPFFTRGLYQIFVSNFDKSYLRYILSNTAENGRCNY
jgi:hypothetical protein